MSALNDPWHLPRPDLAQSYLRSFDLGLTSARGLFAGRRMGKSEFLKHDLLPAAIHDVLENYAEHARSARCICNRSIHRSQSIPRQMQQQVREAFQPE